MYSKVTGTFLSNYGYFRPKSWPEPYSSAGHFALFSNMLSIFDLGEMV
jgi:hypothetical protein